MDWKEQVYIDNDGNLRWKSNDSMPCDNVLEYFCFDLGYEIDIKKCARQREIEIREKLHEYAEKLRNYIPLDDNKDTIIIDIKTGKKYLL